MGARYTTRTQPAARVRAKMWLFGVAFALLVQSLFPSGYMPGNLANGWITMLCPDGLPTAFVEQLRAQVAPLSGPHAHHGAHASGAPDESTSTAMGSCQLGSALDQSMDVALSSSVTVGVYAQPAFAQPRQLGVVRLSPLLQRSRAPPTLNG